MNVLPGIVAGTGTITDDDAAPTVSIAGVSIPEGDAGSAIASLHRLAVGRLRQADRRELRERRRDRGRPDDYAGASGTLSFAPGQGAKTVDVDIVGDTTFENDETFTVALSAPVNVTPGTSPAPSPSSTTTRNRRSRSTTGA